MSSSAFLMLLMLISTLTGLATEAIKKWLQERGKTYHANALAGYVSAVISIAIGAAYVIITGAEINAEMMVYLIALVFLSWLSAMLGYDKVKQTIMQIGTKGDKKA